MQTRPALNRIQELFSKGNLFAFIVLAIGLCVTGLSSMAVYYETQRTEKAAFESDVDNMISIIQRRMTSIDLLLRGGAGLFDTNSEINAETWHRYINALNVEHHSRGMQAIAYAQIVSADRLAQHIKDMRAKGYPNYTVRPSGYRAEYSSVTLIEPQNERNAHAIGIDLMSEPKRAAALQAAIDTGATTMSDKVTLLKEVIQDDLTGFLVFVPVYDRTLPVNTVEQRRAAARGLVYSPFAIEDYVTSIMHGLVIDVDFTIYDGLVKEPKNLLFDPYGNSPTHSFHPEFTESRRLSVFRHDWTFQFDSNANFEAVHRSQLPLFTGIVGVLLSIAVFMILGQQRMRRMQAEKLVQEMYSDILAKQKELEDSESRFRSIIDICPTSTRIARFDTGEILYCNKAYLDLIEVDMADLARVDPQNYYVNPQDYVDIRTRIRNGEAIYDQLVELRNPFDPNSKYKYVLASYFHILYQGKPAVQAWFHDISQRVEAERMKTEFISTVNHELRTPLTAIGGALGLVTSGVLGSLPDQIKAMLQLAENNSKRLAALVNDLLDMEKIAAGKMEFDLQPHALMPMLRQAIEANKTFQSERGVRLEMSETSSDVQIRVDSQRFMQIMNNLLSNAIKYSNEQGVVEIKVDNKHDNKQNRVIISIQDHGAGIPLEFQDKVFQKFTQADATNTRKKGGTGLGLAITQEFVTRMNGKISFVSEPGRGTCFTFEFPVVEG